MVATLLDRLRGGDLRSIGRANEVVTIVEKSPGRFGEVFAGLQHTDPVVKARAADVIEKLTRRHPALLAQHKRQLLAMLQREPQKEVCWHLAQMMPRLAWSARERATVVAALKRYLASDSTIVRVSALDALAMLAQDDETLRHDVKDIVTMQMRTGSAAVQARGRKLLRLLD